MAKPKVLLLLENLLWLNYYVSSPWEIYSKKVKKRSRGNKILDLGSVARDLLLTSILGLLSNHPICLKSGIAHAASWRAEVVSIAKAEWRVLNQAAASAESEAFKTQLWTASGECNSRIRPSNKNRQKIFFVISTLLRLIKDLIKVKTFKRNFIINCSLIDIINCSFLRSINCNFLDSIKCSFLDTIICSFLNSICLKNTWIVISKIPC